MRASAWTGPPGTTGDPGRWAPPDRVGSAPVGNWRDLAEQDGVVALDARERWEWDASHHPHALHVPFYELADRAAGLPAGQLRVYCATGDCAPVAASMLARAGRDAVLLDDFCLPGDVPWEH